jgi:two-component system, cell cycle sensor histidine kinase and response regulator CckA
MRGLHIAESVRSFQTRVSLTATTAGPSLSRTGHVEADHVGGGGPPLSRAAKRPLHRGVARSFRTISRFLAAAVTALGALVLVAWIFDLAIFKSLLPSLAIMKVNSALGFLVLGSAMWLFNRSDALPKRLRAARPLAVAAILIGVVTLLEYVFDAGAGIDRLLLPGLSAGAARAGADRMSPATAANFILNGWALLVLDVSPTRFERRPSEWLAFLSGAVALLALIGYLYGVDSLYRVGACSPMAFHTALAFLACSGAILLARPERGLVRVMTSATPGGLLARRMILPVLLIPPLTGWLRLKGEQLGLYGTGSGLALLALSNIVGFTAFIAWTVRALIGADSAGRRAEKAVREREENLNLTLRSIGDGVISTDFEGRIAEMNFAAEKLTGWSSADAGGMPLAQVFRIINEDSRQPIENPAARVRKEGVATGLPSHTALIARDGLERSIADSCAPIRDASGAMRGVVIVFRDTTEERKAEADARKNEALFTRLSNAGIIGIKVNNLDGTVTYANDAVLQTIGYTREELSSGAFRWSDLTPPEWGVAENAALLELKTSGVSLPREKEYFRKDGSKAPVLVGMAMLDETNRISFVLDLTESRRAEDTRTRLADEARQLRTERRRAEESLRETTEQLRQSQKMEAVGRLAGGIAHDFNNLLSVILGYGRLMLEDLKAQDPMRTEVDEIVRAGSRAASLTRQLLAFSRQQVLQPKVLDLNDTLGGMSRMLGRMIGETIVLTFQPGAALGRVFADPGQIEQIIMNLVLNARDAMPTGGRLTIETDNVRLDDDFATEHSGVRAGPHVMLSVTDTGTGIEKAIQDRIYEPFFTTKEKGKGTGLGLATVFGIVKQSGGTIDVASEPGKGTTFTIYLPRTDQMVESIGDSGRIDLRKTASETILLVEDEEQVRRLTRNILQRAGYQVIESPSGGDALLTCEQHAGAIDLMLTDVVMPKMGGRQLADRLAGIRPRMKVIFMSGYTDDTIVHQGVLDADVAFLQKPLTPGTVLAKVREVLDAPGPRAPGGGPPGDPS